MAFMPAATDLQPSAKMDLVSTVAAVVPEDTQIVDIIYCLGDEMEMEGTYLIKIMR